MEGLKIVGLCIVASVAYGILHDLVTANLCVEYFSVFHPDIFHTNSPWLLALGWGVAATWWMGLILGFFIAAAAQAGPLPKLAWREIVRPLIVLLLVSYAVALSAGLYAYLEVGEIPAWVTEISPRIARAHLSPDKARLFTADLFAHNASYLVSALGAFLLCVILIRARMNHHRDHLMTGRELRV